MVENDKKIVIGAEDQFTEVLDKLGESTQNTVSKANNELDGLAKSYENLAGSLGSILEGGKLVKGFLGDALNLDKDFQGSADTFISGLQNIFTSAKGPEASMAGPEYERNQGASGDGLGEASNGGGEEGLVPASVTAGYEARLSANSDFLGRMLAQNTAAQASEEALLQGGLSKKGEMDKEYNKFTMENAAYAAGFMADTMQAIFVATGSKHKAMFKAYKAFAMAEAIISAIGASVRALREVPIPFNVPVSAAILGLGLARAAAISRQKMSGTTGSVSTGTGGTTISTGNPSPVPLAGEAGKPKPTQNVTVVIHNPLSTQNWAEIVEGEIIPAINDASEKRNVHLEVKTAEG